MWSGVFGSSSYAEGLPNDMVKISKSDPNFQREWDERYGRPNLNTSLGTCHTLIRSKRFWRYLILLAVVLFIKNYIDEQRNWEEQMRIQDDVVDFVLSNPIADTENEPDLSDVTIGIYSFMSHSCLFRAIKSIRKKYSNVWIVVLDDSDWPLFSQGEPDPDPSPGLNVRPPPKSAWNGIGRMTVNDKGENMFTGPPDRAKPKHIWTRNRIRWYSTKDLVFDLGNGAGRNRLVELTHTKYYLQWDDDWVLTNSSDIPLMRSFLDRNNYDIVAGCYESTDVGFFASLDKDSEPGTLLQKGFQHRGLVEDGFVRADVVDHTMLARTSVLMATPWSEKMHADGEHFLLFINFWVEGAKIAATNKFRVAHDRSCRSSRYERFRMRLSEQWFLHGSVTLADLNRFGFKDKQDTYLKVDRDEAEHLLGGAIVSADGKLSYGSNAIRH
eukprot:m.16832 g.16832  ORF g.16832 m.16832 type:complete len:440 (-) comp11229_c0_seq1:93-1412(-)